MNRNLSELEKLMLRRKIERKKRRKRFLFIALLIIILSILLTVGIGIFNRISGNNKRLNLKTLTAPDYVNVDLIDVGLARTGVRLREVNNIVVHYTGNPASTAQNNRDYFDKIDTTVCSHFVIGLEGEIIQCVPLDEKSAASNNRNLDTISIEVCHPTDDGKFNDATLDALVKLTAWLCDNSGLDEKDVIRHYDITGKLCPLYFVENETEWDAFLLSVKEELKKY